MASPYARFVQARVWASGPDAWTVTVSFKELGRVEKTIMEIGLIRVGKVEGGIADAVRAAAVALAEYAEEMRG